MGYIIATEDDLRGTFTVPARPTSGHTIGIIDVNLDYPKLPGNVANASTFSYPVLYRTVDFEIERLFAGDPQILDEIIDAARYLEAQGVAAIVGACGYFAHFQSDIADAVSVPVFTSSLCQLPLIKAGLNTNRSVAVFCADGASLTDELFESVGTDATRVSVADVGKLESFAPIRWGYETLDNGALTDDLVNLAREHVAAHPETGAILFECSDLPPYAAAVSRATGLPVFDFITLIDWIHHAMSQKNYFGSV